MPTDREIKIGFAKKKLSEYDSREKVTLLEAGLAFCVKQLLGVIGEEKQNSK